MPVLGDETGGLGVGAVLVLHDEATFYFTLKSGSGVVLNTEASRKPTVQLSSFAVTRADCIHAGYGNVALTIQSVK